MHVIRGKYLLMGTGLSLTQRLGISLLEVVCALLPGLPKIWLHTRSSLHRIANVVFSISFVDTHHPSQTFSDQ